MAFCSQLLHLALAMDRSAHYSELVAAKGVHDRCWKRGYPGYLDDIDIIRSASDLVAVSPDVASSLDHTVILSAGGMSGTRYQVLRTLHL